MPRCPVCNTPFERRGKFCSTCGANLEKEFISQLICSKCGKKFLEGAIFCDYDGTRLVASESLIKRCVNCGKEYSPDTKFCPTDGGQTVSIISRLASPAYRTFDSQYLSEYIYPKASLGNRFIASLIDFFIALILALPGAVFIVIGFSNLNKRYFGSEAGGQILIGLLLMILPMLYSLLKDGLSCGQSLGKKAMNLMVIETEINAPCSKLKSFLRNLISGLLTAIPYINFITCWIEPIMVLANQDGRKAADFVAKTQVIDTYNYKQQ